MLFLLALIGAAAPAFVNVAKEGSASATSVGWGGVPDRVIDGNTNAYWSGRSCYHSGNANGNRVTVSLPHSDIGIKYPVSKVRVYNRMENDKRINNVQVFAGDHQCGTIQWEQGEKAYLIDCGKKNASEVSVRLSSGWLQFCELEALVLEEDMPTNIPNYINLAINGSATASSVAHGGVPTRVIDGNRNGYWGGRSCYHSSGGSQHRVTVTLPGAEFGAKYPVSFINVYNRMDTCCDERLQGAMVFAGKKQCGQLQFQEGKRKYMFNCGNHSAGEVSVWLNNGQTLQICELEALVLEENMPDFEIPKFVNVAINGSATASSVAHGGVATRVNDGNTNGYWGGRSCYHSWGGSRHRVTVVLPGGEFGVKYPVSFINVYNRMDTCCDQRLQGAMVYAGKKQCGQLQFQEGKQKYMFNCGNHSAGEVSVWLNNGQSLQICELEALVLEENMPDFEIPKFVNVAINGSATATSVAYGGVATRIIDGNTNGFWGGRSCYHSSGGSQHRVTVTLPGGEFGAKYPVSFIKVYNRMDTCCDQRLQGAMVFAGEKQCGQLQFQEGKQMYMFNCGNHSASEVSVKLSNGQTLQICELEVLVLEENMPDVDIPKFVNVAINATAAASSVAHGGVASRVNDGNTNGYWGGRSCYHSDSRAGPKHTVSLLLPAGEVGQKYPVSYVNVYNRLDSCCDERLNGAMVFAGEKQCGQLQFQEGKQKYMFNCGNHSASEVSVKLSSGQSLQICELEVLVMEENMPEPKDVPVFSNVAVKRPTNQSSVAGGGTADRAVDGNKNKWWGGRSCTYTARKTGNFWEVELDQEDYIESVVVHNIVDSCCSGRINGAKVFVGRGSEWELCDTITYGRQSTPVIVVPCNKYGDKVKITQDTNYLNLCEVEVLVPEEVPSEVIDEA